MSFLSPTARHVSANVSVSLKGADQEHVDLPDAAASDSLSGLLGVSAHMFEHQGAPYVGEEVNFCNSFCLLPEHFLSEGFPWSWSGFEILHGFSSWARPPV